jgi:hypothetical protein
MFRTETFELKQKKVCENEDTNLKILFRGNNYSCGSDLKKRMTK